jgi:hypothetical protein
MNVGPFMCIRLLYSVVLLASVALLKLKKADGTLTLDRRSPQGPTEVLEIRNSGLLQIRTQNPSRMKLFVPEAVARQDRGDASIRVAPMPYWNRDSSQNEM